MKLHELYPEVKWINQRDRSFVFEGEKDIPIAIAEDARLNNATIDVTGGLWIGERVHFGHEVMILTTDHPPTIANGKERQETLRCCPVEIGDDTYIGSRAMILKGVKIGKGAYIAAGTVLTKDVGDHELWAGVPAKKVRSL